MTNFEKWLKDANLPSGATEEYKLRKAFEAGSKVMEKLLGKRVLELQVDKGRLEDENRLLCQILSNLGYSLDKTLKKE